MASAAETKKKNLVKKEHDEFAKDQQPEVWGRVSQIKRQDTFEEFKSMQNAELETLKAQLEEAEAELAEENVNMEEIKNRVGVADDILEAGKTKLAQAMGYVELVKTIKKPNKVISEAELEKVHPPPVLNTIVMCG